MLAVSLLNSIDMDRRVVRRWDPNLEEMNFNLNFSYYDFPNQLLVIIKPRMENYRDKLILFSVLSSNYTRTSSEFEIIVVACHYLLITAMFYLHLVVLCSSACQTKLWNSQQIREISLQWESSRNVYLRLD